MEWEGQSALWWCPCLWVYNRYRLELMQPSTREGFLIILSVLSHHWSILHFLQERDERSIVCCLYVKVKVAQSCPTLCHPMDYTYSPWNSPGQNTGVGNLSVLQGIFPTQGSNPGLLHCGQIPYQLSHKGSPCC